ncbi:MAG: pilus assembly protein CpaC, partial [Acidobacteriaceae bacterium]|nr:pilus assembly protein CpaC [Acidobacteriaceae bacterium]
FLFICAASTLPAQTSRPPYSPSGAPTAMASQDSSNELFVAVDKSVLVDVARPVQRIAVGLGEFAEATAVSRSEILVNGKAPGETSLIVWEEGGGRQFFNVIVRPSAAAANDRMEALRRELKTELPEQQVKVSFENGLIFLRGTVKDLTSSDRAVQIASTAGKVVNLLYVAVPSADPQILLKVRFASVDRTLTKTLGVNLFSLGAGNTIGTVGTGQFPIPTVTDTAPNGPIATVSNALNLFFFRPDLNLGATIEALESQGLVEVLAEPNVLATNGKQASFLAGGDYPYPVVQGVSGGIGGAVTILFKEFGVRLNFIPTITPRGTIRLQVAPEVSSLDFTQAVIVSGFQIPSIDIRRVKTEVELNDGQSFAIGGLLDNRETKTFQKIPFIGDVPILGKFFQSISKTRSNTELMVIVTPELVAPIPAGQPVPELKYPDKFLPSNSNIPMTTPGANVTGAKAPAAPPPTIPVEKLIQSMQPEQPLVTDSGYTTGGYSVASQAGASSGTPAAPPAPQ